MDELESFPAKADYQSASCKPPCSSARQKGPTSVKKKSSQCPSELAPLAAGGGLALEARELAAPSASRLSRQSSSLSPALPTLDAGAVAAHLIVALLQWRHLHPDDALVLGRQAFLHILDDAAQKVRPASGQRAAAGVTAAAGVRAAAGGLSK